MYLLVSITLAVSTIRLGAPRSVSVTLTGIFSSSFSRKKLRCICITHSTFCF